MMTHFSEKPDFFKKPGFLLWKRMLLSRYALVAVFVLLLAARMIYPLADPPENLSWSLGLFFDEGIYNHNARNQVLFGQWQLDEWNDFYYAPISSWLKYQIFRLFGAGRVQMRMISVMFSWFALLWMYFAVRASYDKLTAVCALLLLGTNDIFLMYNRLGMQDTQTLAIFILCFYFWQKGVPFLERNRVFSKNPVSLDQHTYVIWCFFLAGIACFLTYTFKNLFLYLLPVPFAALVLDAVFHIRNHERLKRSLMAVGLLSAGCGLSFVVWYAAFYRPNRDIIEQFGGYMMSLMFPRFSLGQILLNIHQTPFFLYFSKNPTILFGSLVFLLYIVLAIWSKEREHLPPTDLFLALWFGAAFVFSGMIAYRPTRYFLPIIPPMCLLTARLISVLFTDGGRCSQALHALRADWGARIITWLWIALSLYYGVFPELHRFVNLSRRGVPELRGIQGLLVSLGCSGVLTGLLIVFFTRWFSLTERHGFKTGLYATAFLLLGISLSVNLSYYVKWVRSPRYAVHAAGQDLMTRLGTSAAIGGMNAPGVAFDTPYKTLFSWENFANYKENPIEKYHLTHLFLADHQSVRERHYYLQRYPRNMASAKLLQQYYIKDAIFSLFSLIEPQIEYIHLEKTRFGPQEPLPVIVHVKNHDFRESKKLHLTWSLYPDTEVSIIRPASVSHPLQFWLDRQEEQRRVATGNAPQTPGTYHLLISLVQGHEQYNEMSAMLRQSGQLVPDPDAIGQRVVYHDPKTSPDPGFLAYGNYSYGLPGVYEVVFRAKITDNSLDVPVLTFEAAANFGTRMVRQIDVRGSDFPESGDYQSFFLSFLLKEPVNQLEYRIYSFGKTEVWVDAIHSVFQEGKWYESTLLVQ